MDCNPLVKPVVSPAAAAGESGVACKMRPQTNTYSPIQNPQNVMQNNRSFFSTSRSRAWYFSEIMKANHPRSTKSAVITNSRWLAYATASATSAFAATQSAEATIHYSGPINQIFKGCARTATFTLDQPGDFIRLRHSSLACSPGYSGSGFFNVGGLAGASIAGFYNDCGGFNPVSASNVKRGQPVSNGPFVPAGRQSALLAGENHTCPGQFPKGIGYIGFKFNNGSGDHYGWVRIKTRQGIEHHFILRDFAYGDVGDRIRAGQKSSNEIVPEESDGIVPQEGSLGGLALGAVGLLAWRKRRPQGAS
jgi:hypothetical protein